jgi:SAM-dependent MidA family methyltransferase
MRGRLVGAIWTANVGRRSYTVANKSKGFWDSPERADDNQLVMAKVFGGGDDESSKRIPTNGPRTLVRRFIADSLYSPTHGYFTRNKKLQILDAPAALDFKSLPSLTAFQEALSTLYASQTISDVPGMEQPLPQMDSGGQATGFRSQVWHTPTELFKPWFGIAIAERIVERHLSRQSSTDALIIYEAGPGNGTLMRNILDHLSAQYPHLYASVEYNLIEISPNLAQKLPLKDSPHASKIRLTQKSILDWTDVEERPCFVIAMEVIVWFSYVCNE